MDTRHEPTDKKHGHHPQPREPKIWQSFKFWMTPRSSRFLQAELSGGVPGILAGYALIGAVLAFGGLGYLLDHYLNTTPWFVLIGLLSGICIGFYGLVSAGRRK